MTHEQYDSDVSSEIDFVIVRKADGQSDDGQVGEHIDKSVKRKGKDQQENLDNDTSPKGIPKIIEITTQAEGYGTVEMNEEFPKDLEQQDQELGKEFDDEASDDDTYTDMPELVMRQYESDGKAEDDSDEEDTDEFTKQIHNYAT